jgi:phage gp29-like protein
MPSPFARFGAFVRGLGRAARTALAAAAAAVQQPQAWANPEPRHQQPDRRIQGANLLGFGDYPVSVVSTWTVDDIKGALDAHELGYFQRSSQLAEAMTRDDRVAATLRTRVLALLGCEHEMLPAERASNDRKARRAMREIGEVRSQIITGEVLAQMRRWDCQMGFCLVEVIWETKEDLWMPRLKVWHPQFTYYNQVTRQYFVMTAEGPVAVTPGDGHWILYSSSGEYRGWMDGSVRGVAMPWVGRSMSFIDWCRYNEIHGSPWKKAMVPARATPQMRDDFWTSLANMGSEFVVECVTGMGPEGKDQFDVDLVEPQNSTAWEGFKEFRGECSTSIAIGHLGQNLSTESGGSGLSKGDMQKEVRQDYLEADAKGLEDCLNTQLWRPFCQYNYGDPTLAPRDHWKVKPAEDLHAEANTFSTVMTAVGTGVLSGVPLDLLAICDRFKIPLRADATDTPQPVVAPAPGQDGQPPGAPTSNGDPNAPAPAAPPNGPPTPAMAAAAMHAAVKRTNAIAGQMYVDAVADKGRAQTARVMAGALGKVLDAIKTSKNYDELRTKLPRLLRGFDTAQAAQIMESSIVLAHLAGRHAVREDL